jgi:hypothetical protein
MSRKPEITFTTYAELRHTARKFAQGEIPLMILVGTPGLGKTQILEEACHGIPFLKVDGKKGPLDLFVDLHRNIDQPVILDDVDPLLKNSDGQVLIRQLTDTKPLKGVSWGTRTTVLDNLNPPVPRHFYTRSPVCLITNKWRSTGIFGAIESRAMLFRFDPCWTEAYQYAGTWFKDQQILDFIHGNLAQMRRPDLRLLKQAVTLRSLGLPTQDWRQAFSHCLTVDRVEQEVRRLMALKVSNAERARQFVSGGFGNRATYYRRFDKIKNRTPQAIPPRIVVNATATAEPTTASGTTSGKTPARASRKPAKGSAAASPTRTATASPRARNASRKPRATSRRRKPLPR